MDVLNAYLYCFARCGAVHHLAVPDAEGPIEIAVLEGAKAAAVYRPVLPDEFGQDPSAERAQDPAWLIRRACHHERVIEEVMRLSPVVPVRFGTILESREALEQLLADRGDEIAAMLDSLSDKDEWAVKGFVDEKRAGEWLLESDPVLARRHRGLPQAAGTRYLQEKRLMAEVEEASRLWACAAAEQVRDALKGHVLAASVLSVQARDMTGRAEEMAFNFAFLVARSRAAAFSEQVAKIGAAYRDQGLSVEVSGPWPPYNFCTPVEAGRDEPLSLLRPE